MYPYKILGIKFDPFRSTRFASFSDDGYIKIWDLRKLRSSILDIPVRERVIQIDWSPSRPDVLASCSRYENFIRMWTISDPNRTANQSGEKKSLHTDIPCRLRSAPGPHVSSFSWHPEDKQRMLMVSVTGTVEDIFLHDSIPLTFSPNNDFSFAVNDRLVLYHSLEMNSDLMHDISAVMRTRATKGYSLDVNNNINLLRQEVQHEHTQEILKGWSWIQDCSPHTHQTHLRGIISLFEPVEPTSLVKISKDNVMSSFRLYTSPQREKAIRMCGWWNTMGTAGGNYTTDSEKKNFENALRNLENAGEYEKAAALAIFHLDLERGLLALSQGAKQPNDANSHLGLIALALSGFSYSLQGADTAKTSQNLWKKTYTEGLKEQIKSPYLQAAFVFLSAAHDSESGLSSLRSILFHQGIQLRERVAFGCRFLPDKDLSVFLSECSQKGLETGTLDTLLLTGLGNQGIVLLQNFVDRTSDVQTAALLACFSAAYFPAVDQKPKQWVSLYTELLNTWKLWTIRSKLDVARATLTAKVKKSISSATPSSKMSSTSEDDPGAEFEPQVYLRCAYCGQSLSRPDMSVTDRRTGNRLGRNYGRLFQSTARLRGCPACKKPLPRCALCLEPFDCATTYTAPRTSAEDDLEVSDNSAANPFSKWMTWCQSCRHGGHVEHLAEWFSSHNECPVVDCTCRCISLDSVDDPVETTEMIVAPSPAPIEPHGMPAPESVEVASSSPKPATVDSNMLQTQFLQQQQKQILQQQQQLHNQLQLQLQLQNQLQLQQRQRQQVYRMVSKPSYPNLYKLQSDPDQLPQTSLPRGLTKHASMTSISQHHHYAKTQSSNATGASNRPVSTNNTTSQSMGASAASTQPTWTISPASSAGSLASQSQLQNLQASKRSSSSPALSGHPEVAIGSGTGTSS